MDTTCPLPLLGGLSAATFMRRHWQKTPLLVRAALADALPGIDRQRLFALAARDDVESRLVVNDGDRWSARAGPISRRALPPVRTCGWTLLVQGVDLHDDAAHRLLARFRFVADARLDDLMLSFASDGGGVGPHVDSYDVFLLQIEGQRRWRVGPVKRQVLRADVPLKMLAAFVARKEWLLEPGDMLYLPPGWGHDGVAVGPCITCSIGFRAPDSSSLAADMLQRLAEIGGAASRGDRPAAAAVYRDAGQRATGHPARVPAALQRFADASVKRSVGVRELREQALGEVLSEPKPGTWFARRDGQAIGETAIVLDRGTRMLYDRWHVFVNGETFRPRGRDATLLRRLGDARRLDAAGVQELGGEARQWLADWLAAGWCRRDGDGIAGGTS